MKTLYGNLGNAQDIINSLRFEHPEASTIQEDIEHLELSIEDERMFRNRATVIKILETKLKKFKKFEQSLK